VPNNEYGDFQTPLDLAIRCLQVLGLPGDARVLEPTCGLGSFLEASALISPDSERRGLELQPDHASVASKWADVTVGNIFKTNLPATMSWHGDGSLFVVGNPPWVTSAELNRMDSDNLPPKENFKGARGFDAMLGSSNFDVCEYILLKVLNEYRNEPLSLGMLCKTQVARNVIEYAASARLPLRGAAIFRIDAMKWFDAAVDACWFVVNSSPVGVPDYTATIHEDLFNPAATDPRRFGSVDGLMVSDVERYVRVRDADGTSPYEWRSGLKHDASDVFELRATPRPTTKAGQLLDLEPEWVFPFLKNTDVFRNRARELSKWVIVPQKTFGAETATLETEAPKLWAYLTANSDALDGRKSSIYRNRPRFAVFGHGDYTWATYKVAVSGLHKTPEFRLIAPIGRLPVVLDDTCYFLPFEDSTEAAVVTAVLNSDAARDLIESMVFWDSKRPITKKLLSRVDLNRLRVDWSRIVEAAAGYAASCDVPFSHDRADRLFNNLHPAGAPTPKRRGRPSGQLNLR
jgi:hypothetical protein